MSTEQKPLEGTVTAPSPSAEIPARRQYEAPRIERRIPIAANTLQPSSGSESVFPEE